MKHKSLIRIATRKSALALWQAEYVKAKLLEAHPGISVELVPMVTKGDIILDSPLSKVGGKGLFIKELEVAMMNDEADLAVHSMKDVPMELPQGFGIHAICQREDPRDAFVSNQYADLSELPAGSIVGTSSLRRQCQLKASRPDLVIKDLRGNVNTRLQKLDDGQYDAIILASAGLIRLEMAPRINQFIAPEIILPAVGQGAVGIECRNDDTDLLNLLKPLNHEDTAQLVSAERTLNRKLEGGCQVPIASYAQWQGSAIWLQGLVGHPDGSGIITAQAEGNDPVVIGNQVADALLSQGAADILATITLT